MAIEVDLVINTNVEAELVAAKQEALKAGGEVVRLAAIAATPVDTSELVDSCGPVQVAGQVAAVSYTDWKAVIVHENMYDHHEHGHAKFLELAAAEKGDAAYAEMAQVLARVFM